MTDHPLDISAYSSPYVLGHKALASLWDTSDGPVWVQEKIDGSQISFRRDGDRLSARSRRQDLTSYLGDLVASDGMFANGLRTIVRLKDQLHDGWTYRGEYLQKPKHNTLAYDRVPNDHIILFDVDTGIESYLNPQWMAAEAERLGLENVPLLAAFESLPPLDRLEALLQTPSILGGGPVEGIVLKNYSRFGPDKKALMAKMVREDFQEAQKAEWKRNNPGKNDAVKQLGAKYGGEARWRKAMQHLRESGRLQGAPQDIPVLLQEVYDDVMVEQEDEIRDFLLKTIARDLKRALTRGLPEWYKRYLASQGE